METKDSNPYEVNDNIHHRLVRDTELRFSVIAEPYNRKAYRLMLNGRFHWNAWNGHSIRQALRCFRDVIVVSPQYVEAYCWLANCYIYLGMTGAMYPRRAFEKAERVMSQAKRLDASRGELFIAQALIDTFLNYDYQKASMAFEQAFSLHERPYFYHLYALFLMAVGKPEPAIESLEAALDSDPENTLFNSELGRAYYYNRQYPEALEQYEYALDLDSAFPAAYSGKGWVYIAMGNYDAAHAAFQAYQNLMSHRQKNVPHLVFLAAVLGMNEVTAHFLNVLQVGEEEQGPPVTSLELALIYQGLGKKDETFFHLQQAVEDHLGTALLIKADPMWDNLKHDIRYKELLRRMNLIHTEHYLPVLLS